MSSKKRTKNVSSRNRRNKTHTSGRKELDDPVTQVSTFKVEEHYADLFSSSPHKERYISQISKSPSPPLSKLKSFSQNRSQSSAFDERKDVIVEAKANDNLKDETKTTTFDGLSAFLQELDKQTQMVAPLPKCPRFTSKRACRFELPIDLRLLEDMTPMIYLKKYCVVTPIKELSYKKFFNKHCKLNVEDALKNEHLPAALGDGFSRQLNDEDMHKLHEYLHWDRLEDVEEKSFIVISAFYERYLCVINGETSEDLKQFDTKDELEVADFTHLNKKLCDINLNENLLALLNFVQDS